MYKKTVLVFVTLFIAAHGTPKISLVRNIIGRSLYDDAEEKLKELEILVNSKINSAETELEAAKADFYVYGSQAQTKGASDIDNEAKRVEEILRTLRGVIDSSTFDDCIDGRESFADNLAEVVIENMKTCISDTNSNVETQTSTAISSVDNTINSLWKISSDLEECDSTGNDSIVCISAVIESIDAAVVDIPQTIDREVRTATNVIENFISEIDECKKSYTTEYVSSMTTFLDDIDNCVK